MLTLLLPYVAGKVEKAIDRLTLDDLSPHLVRRFLTHLEQQRQCAISTRNQRLAGIHALARFIGEHSPEHIDWCSQIRLIPLKKTSQPAITYLDKPEMDALLATPDAQTAQGYREHALLLFLYNSGGLGSVRQYNSKLGISIGTPSASGSSARATSSAGARSGPPRSTDCACLQANAGPQRRYSSIAVTSR